MVWPFVFVLILLIHLGYWLALDVGFRRATRVPASEEPPTRPVSVIVAVRNEASSLPALLDALDRQTYPHAEFIFVDDASTDETATLLANWQAEHPNRHVLTVANPIPPRKKNALTQGIAAARYERLVFTDADCLPPPQWLATLARYAAAEPEALFLGYSPFLPAPGVRGKLARYETFLTGFLTAAAAGLHHPFMAVGRNLSYPKSVFNQIGGFAHSKASMSGDDDLLVQEVHRHRAAPIYALVDPATFVPTETPPTWASWLRGKRRHVSAGAFYRRSVLLHLGLFQGTGVALWIGPWLTGWVGAGLLGAKLLVQFLVLHRAAGRLQEQRLLPWLPLLDALHTLYLVLITPLGLIPPKRW